MPPPMYQRIADDLLSKNKVRRLPPGEQIRPKAICRKATRRPGTPSGMRSNGWSAWGSCRPGPARERSSSAQSTRS